MCIEERKMKKTWLLLISVLFFAVAVHAFYTTPAFAEDNHKSEFGYQRKAGQTVNSIS